MHDSFLDIMEPPRHESDMSMGMDSYIFTKHNSLAKIWSFCFLGRLPGEFK